MGKHNGELIQKLKEAYATAFSSLTPEEIIFAPGRINLIGEHVDYNDGSMLPAAINLGIYFVCGSYDSQLIDIHSIDFNESTTFDPNKTIRKSINPHWSNYLLGVIDQFKRKSVAIPGFKMVFAGDLPYGAGLSSSAALACGFVHFLNQLTQANFTKKDLALISQKAEQEFAGVNCGIMDQISSLFGKENSAIHLDSKTLEVDYINLNLGKYSLVLFNSNIKHSHSESEYNLRRAQCENALSIIHSATGKNSFREIGIELVESLKIQLGPDLYARAKFVVTEIERVQSAATLLEQNKLTDFGRLMNESHKGLSDLYEVSCPELDFLQKSASSKTYVLGSRMMGGGFGGCTINLLETAHLDDLIVEISTQYKDQFGLTLQPISVNIGAGTSTLKFS